MCLYMTKGQKLQRNAPHVLMLLPLLQCTKIINENDNNNDDNDKKVIINNNDDGNIRPY